MAETEQQPTKHPKPRPKGEPASVTKVRELIEERLSSMFDAYVCDEHSNYVLGMDSARIFVVPTWLDDDGEDGPTVIRLFAITNLDVPVTAELTKYLLAANLEFVFGCFALDPEAGAIWFVHNLLGDHTAPEELEASLAAVAQTADRVDNEIKERFGGRLYVEKPDQVIPPPPAPGYL
jgi:hypothetical protein